MHSRGPQGKGNPRALCRASVPFKYSLHSLQCCFRLACARGARGLPSQQTPHPCCPACLAAALHLQDGRHVAALVQHDQHAAADGRQRDTCTVWWGGGAGGPSRRRSATAPAGRHWRPSPVPSGPGRRGRPWAGLDPPVLARTVCHEQPEAAAAEGALIIRVVRQQLIPAWQSRKPRRLGAIASASGASEGAQNAPCWAACMRRLLPVAAISKWRF